MTSHRADALRTRRVRPRRLTRYVTSASLIVVTTIAVAVPLGRHLEGGPFVARISFVNPTAYDLRIEVTDTSRQGWAPVVTAQRTATTVAERVLDQGDVWIFRFSAQGEEVRELRLQRTQLASDRWHVRIPAELDADLKAKGTPPTP